MLFSYFFSYLDSSVPVLFPHGIRAALHRLDRLVELGLDVCCAGDSSIHAALLLLLLLLPIASSSCDRISASSLCFCYVLPISHIGSEH